MLVVDNLSVSYGRVKAVRGVSFDAHAGELVALVGANGAGKTSVLSALAGLLKPSGGTVRFRGRDVTRSRSSTLVAEGLLLVPEGRRVLATMTVTENLQLGGWKHHHGAHERIDEMFALFPVLSERRHAAAGTLSGGEQQMLAIARALVARPTLLMMDEPSMGLAPLVVDEVFRVIESIRAGGTTVLLVEQNARRALRIADRAYVMETGEIVHRGTGAELLADDRVVQAYLGIE